MFTVHIARVKLDSETGAYRLLGYAAIQDVGHAINPPEVVGQIHGGAVQALGRAFGEELVYDGDGQLRTASFLDYEVPAADQIPLIDVGRVEVPSPIGPLGAKGVASACDPRHRRPGQRGLARQRCACAERPSTGGI